MRRYDELSRGAERSSPRQFFPDCTIAMCGYDFREGQGPGAAGWTHPPGTRPFNAGDAEAVPAMRAGEALAGALDTGMLNRQVKRPIFDLKEPDRGETRARY